MIEIEDLDLELHVAAPDLMAAAMGPGQISVCSPGAADHVAFQRSLYRANAYWHEPKPLLYLLNESTLGVVVFSNLH